jgi:peptidyl-prolyl cis-trans isomerase SurA
VTAALAAALLLFAAAFAPVGLAQDAPPRPQGGGPGAIGIAAEVNGAPITRRDLAEELSLDPDWLRLERQSGKANEQLRKTIRRRALDLLIDDILIAQAAKRRKVSFTPDEERDLENRFEEWARESYGSVEAFGEYLRDRGSTLAKQKERFWNHFRLLKLLDQDVYRTDAFVRPAEIRDYYAAHREEYRQSGRVRFAHIDFLLSRHSPEEARALAEEVIKEEKAGKPFADLARERSEGPHAESGGSWTVESFDSLQKELARALRTLKPGEVSGVVATPRYLTVLKLEEVVTESYRPFEEVEPEIEKKLQEQKRIDQLAALKARLREEATIKLAPGALD